MARATTKTVKKVAPKAKAPAKKLKVTASVKRAGSARRKGVAKAAPKAVKAVVKTAVKAVVKAAPKAKAPKAIVAPKSAL
jgi:hypothetical protein